MKDAQVPKKNINLAKEIFIKTLSDDLNSKKTNTNKKPTTKQR